MRRRPEQRVGKVDFEGSAGTKESALRADQLLIANASEQVRDARVEAGGRTSIRFAVRQAAAGMGDTDQWPGHPPAGIPHSTGRAGELKMIFTDVSLQLSRQH